MSAPRGIKYIPAIDGLRAVAVIAVMLYIYIVVRLPSLQSNWPDSCETEPVYFRHPGYICLIQ